MEQDGVRDCVVLGGGLTGVTFALEAARRGKQVTVLEAAPQVGGLARTLVFGDYRFDLGGHRFHSTLPEVNQWVRDLLGGNLLEVDRRSRIRLGDRYVDYPLRLPSALTALPAPAAARVMLDYIRTPMRDRDRAAITFEDWVVQRFGRALHEIYFRPYTEKVWGMPCRHLSADWATQRIQLGSLAAAVRESFLKRRSALPTLTDRFLYPDLGIGELPSRAAERALETGRTRLQLNSHVTSLTFHPESHGWQVGYRHAGQACNVQARHVVSTIPLPSLPAMLPDADRAACLAADDLDYRSVICVFIAAEGPRVSQDTWTYFPDQHIIFGRAHEPLNWSPHMVPDGKTSLCLEIFCSEGDDMWQRRDGALIDDCLEALEALDFLPRCRVQESWLVRVPHAYPIYRVGYAEKRRAIRDALAPWPTLHCIGRTGAFRYQNMDTVIADALKLARAPDLQEPHGV